jgi:hypothetical protein
VGLGDGPQVHVERGRLPAQHPEHGERGWIEPGEHQDPAACAPQRGHALVEGGGQRVGIGARPQDVVAAGGQADQVGRHLDGPRDLLGGDLPQQLPAHRQIGVAQSGLMGRHHVGEAVGPAAVAAVRQPVVQALGKAVAQGGE